MPSVPAMRSLLDDADFPAELDKLDGAPKADAHSAYWDHASSRVDAADEGPFRALMLEPPAPASEPTPVQRTRPLRLEKPVRPQTPPSQRVCRVGDPGPGRIDTPFRPQLPARPKRSVQREGPVRPRHVDEIGNSGLTIATVGEGVSVSQPRRVPVSLAALTMVLCLGAGAGSAAPVFHDRVEHIAATWSK